MACKIVGERYKKNFPYYKFDLNQIIYDVFGKTIHNKAQAVVGSVVTDGIRLEIVHKENGIFLVDAWQKAIVMNANTVSPGLEGNFPGDDNAKINGLKFVLTGNSGCNTVEVKNLGNFDMPNSLLDLYRKQIKKVFQCKNYIIGNAILYPKNICHSFVLLEWEKDVVLVYDPWDGISRFYNVQAVFLKGFVSALGVGIIKWIQYIDSP